MKKAFEFKTKTIVATGLGAALFTLLFMYVKVPSWIPETSLQTAYGVSAFFGALFGPIAGGLIAFIGHAISDSVQYGSAWWSWVIASGVSGFVTGFAYMNLKVDEGIFGLKDIVTFNVYQIIGNIIAWIIVAPVLDIVIYAEPVSLVFTQGVVAALLNAVSTGVVGTVLLVAYSKTRSAKGSLAKGE
ncbi:MAG: ECF-type riboflavin transporter substrate-binding protein [Lachnospiraceae bacterium]